MKAKPEKLKKSRNTPKNRAKRLSIAKAAERVFAKKGFHEATIADIAKMANISEATIYEYFISKEELLFSIPEEKTKQHLKKNEDILQYVQGAANKLRVLIYRHLRLYALNPDYAKLVMLILKTNRNFLKTKAYKHIQKSARLTIKVLEEGIGNGEFRTDTKPYLLRAMIYGAIEHLVIRNSLLGVPEDLLSLSDDITNNILQGIMTTKKETGLKIHVTLETKGQARSSDDGENHN